MIPVTEAQDRILAAMTPIAGETVGLGQALGRVLAEDVAARRTQPPVAMSAMDGYAVRSADVANPPVDLKCVGEAPAGGAYESALQAGEAVRIFTGGPLPEGADAVVMQEDTEAEDDRVTIKTSVAEGRFVRPAGQDFREGEIGLTAGHRLSPRDIGLAASMNVPWLAVRRQPRIAILATGDELVRPGEQPGPHQIIASNTLALAALVTANGGLPMDLGIARDTSESLQRLAAGARGADMLVTIGGASVGDYDLVRSALVDSGFDLGFWKIAMRPGKPLIFGRLGDVPLLGLPGNPASAQICALIFLLPAMRRMLGQSPERSPRSSAVLGVDLPANSAREAYLRSSLEDTGGGRLEATPFKLQDSSVLSRMARADCLVVQPAGAPAQAAGEDVEIILLGEHGANI